MACTILIRPRAKGERPIIPEEGAKAQPGDFILDLDINTQEDKVDVRGHLGEITNIKVEGPKSVYRNPRLGWLLIVIGVLVFGAFVPSALYLYYHHKDPWSLVIVAAWTVGVPIYFFLEHEIVFFRWGDPTQYERFKSVQAVATKIWAGGIAVLGLIFASAATSGGFPT